MENTGVLCIKIQGEVNGVKLKPEVYDIKEVMSILSNVDNILYPSSKDRPMITYEIGEGSVLHKFRTGVQAIIGATAIFTAIKNNENIDFLDLRTAKAIEDLQNVSYKKNYSFEITTSESNEILLDINPTTKYIKSTNYFVDSEMYFYGEVTNFGGDSKSNIHIKTKDYGTLIIQTNKEYIKELELNPVYKNYGIRTKIKQNPATGEFEKNNIVFIELLSYTNIYEKDYLDELIDKAKHNWKDINADDWLNDLRGGYDA